MNSTGGTDGEVEVTLWRNGDKNPANFEATRHDRALSDPMQVLWVTPQGVCLVLGASGKSYTVTPKVKRVSCTCPDANRGIRSPARFCKHAIFVLVRVLGYQGGDLSGVGSLDPDLLRTLVRKAPSPGARECWACRQDVPLDNPNASYDEFSVFCPRCGKRFHRQECWARWQTFSGGSKICGSCDRVGAQQTLLKL